jgi:hypothetical protein
MSGRAKAANSGADRRNARPETQRLVFRASRSARGPASRIPHQVRLTPPFVAQLESDAQPRPCIGPLVWAGLAVSGSNSTAFDLMISVCICALNWTSQGATGDWLAGVRLLRRRCVHALGLARGPKLVLLPVVLPEVRGLALRAKPGRAAAVARSATKHTPFSGKAKRRRVSAANDPDPCRHCRSRGPGALVHAAAAQWEVRQ